MVHEGGRVCGRVRYRVAGSPIVVPACHCPRCQTPQTGSALALNAMIESDRISLVHGPPVDREINGGHICIRCPICHVGAFGGQPLRVDRLKGSMRGLISDASR